MRARRGATWIVDQPAGPDGETGERGETGGGGGHCVVCGLGRFGLRVTERLCEAGHAVVVITRSDTRPDSKRSARAVGARIIEGDYRFADVLAQADVARARALLLVSSNDSANLETALDVRRIAPHVRLVLRSDKGTLAERLEHDFGIAAVLSPPVLAAGHFVRAALDAPPTAPSPSSPPRPRATSGPPPRFAVRPRGIAGPRDLFFALPEPARVLFALFLLFAGGVTFFRHALDLPLADAIYFTSTIVTTVGFGDYNLKDEHASVQLFGSLLMFAGVVLIAVLSSFLTNYFVSGAAARRRAERAVGRLRGHVILCGLGSVGFEVAELLLARGVPVVAVDETPGDALWQNLSQRQRVPLLAGDAVRPDVLGRAGIGKARALIAATSEDAVNLEIGLVAQTLAEEHRAPDRPLRIVLRCFDPDLAARVHALSGTYTLLSSAEIAAPLFVRAATTPDR